MLLSCVVLLMFLLELEQPYAKCWYLYLFLLIFFYNYYWWQGRLSSFCLYKKIERISDMAF